jgi:hypothetical protein
LVFFDSVDQDGVSFEMLEIIVTVNEDSDAEIFGLRVVGDLEVFFLIIDRCRDVIDVVDVFVDIVVMFGCHGGSDGAFRSNMLKCM